MLAAIITPAQFLLQNPQGFFFVVANVIQNFNTLLGKHATIKGEKIQSEERS